MANAVVFRSKTNVVEEYLRSKITRGEIRPGQRLQQDAVAREIGVSSTPVREALRRLEAEGLVTYLPHKGVAVQDVGPTRVREVFQLRALLESFATREAMPRLTDDDLKVLSTLQKDMRSYQRAGDNRNFMAANDQWHMIIHRASGSELLRQTIARLWRVSPWDTLWVIPGRTRAALQEHQRILDALENRNSAEAERAMAEHIRSGEQMLLEFLKTRKTARRSRVK
jgi:DNA-binding GntR family transcriptional regulator